jgi:CubicO group peptidase (beta-lactamase class C family)
LIVLGCSGPDKKIPEKSLQGSIFPQMMFVDEHAKIDSFFQSRYRRGLFNGVALFAKEDYIIYKAALGYSNLRSKDTLLLDSEFQLASTTKPLTAYAVLLLVNQGLISLQDSIRKFIPRFPYENITVEQLLIHRSGLPNYMYFSDEYWRDKRYLTISNNDVIDLMVEYEPRKYYSPGRRYNYSNTNYAVLASIIEVVSGKSYSEFMREEVFKPLGMNNSSVYNKNQEPENNHKVIGYAKRRRKAENSYLNGVVGDKGIYSTVDDLYLFNRELYKGSLVSKELINSSYFLGHKDLYDHDNYGYGWRVNLRKDSTMVVHHTGWWKGFRTYFYRELDTEKTIIILTNRSSSWFYSAELLKLFDIATE